MAEDLRLTHIHTNVTAEQTRKTHAGMMHWAGTGPKGKTCRECRHWKGENGERYSGSGELKPAPCRLYAARMIGKPPKVPHSAAACKYFEEDAVPLKAFAKKSMSWS